MAPPPASVAQIHERFEAVPMAGFVPDGRMQTTVAGAVSCAGIGLHSGSEVSFTLRPATANTGVVFVRTDIENPEEAIIPALFPHVCQVTLCSVIGNMHGHTVGTVEHLMAALAGMGIDNVIIEIDGSEVPVMDGSSSAFVDLIEQAGIEELSMARRMIRIVRPIRVEDGDKVCELLPDDETVFEADIDFDNDVIGRQTASVTLKEGSFRTELADARTFGMLQEVQAMHAAGLALGGSLDNAVVVDGDRVLNEGGLRCPDEFVRHKLLDAVGDLYLAGLRIIGRYRGVKSGHALHNKLLHALFTQNGAFEIVTLGETPDLQVVVAAE